MSPSIPRITFIESGEPEELELKVKPLPCASPRNYPWSHRLKNYWVVPSRANSSMISLIGTPLRKWRPRVPKSPKNATEDSVNKFPSARAGDDKPTTQNIWLLPVSPKEPIGELDDIVAEFHITPPLAVFLCLLPSFHRRRI